jgi:hypothetical protein|tara:strand:+ start:1215 stop:1427 length:213 start_codon:yes stop_codon:yes gene_type:complete
MNRQALRLTIAIVRKMMPLILNLLKNVEAARSESSEGGKKITRNEKWMIAEEASFQIMPALIETIADALE